MSTAAKLACLVAEACLTPLTALQSQLFTQYVELFLRWNQKINLSSIRDVDEILRRHILESVACAQAIPHAITSLLDFGSGGGLPGIPIAILHPQIQITLAESQSKKAAFLAEVLRSLKLNCSLHSTRAEQLNSTFDCVTLRAVDKMPAAVKAATHLLNPRGCLVLMTTISEADTHLAAAGSAFTWLDPLPLYDSASRIILIGGKA